MGGARSVFPQVPRGIAVKVSVDPRALALDYAGGMVFILFASAVTCLALAAMFYPRW